MEKLQIVPSNTTSNNGRGPDTHRLGFNAQDEILGSWCEVLPHLFCDESITHFLALCCHLNS